MRKKNTIRLNESTLNRIIKESVKRVLMETQNMDGMTVYDREETEGFRRVFAFDEDGDKIWNFIDSQGNILSPEWFSRASEFGNGYAIVRKNGMYNCINTQGNLMSKRWFNYITPFENNGYTDVALEDNKGHLIWNIMDRNGKIMRDQWLPLGDTRNTAYYFK